MTRVHGGRLLATLAAFVLIGWGVGALCTSALGTADLDAVRDVAASRTASATVAAHVFSWIGSGFVVFPLAAVFGVSMYWRGRRAAAIAVALSTLGGLAIVNADKLLVGRPRPPLRHLDKVTGYSFPSAHAAHTAALCAVLLIVGGATRRGARAAVAVAASCVLVACVAFSRVYLGVHYPSDVVAGVVVGAAWSLAASRLSHGDRQPVAEEGRPGRPGGAI